MAGGAGTGGVRGRRRPPLGEYIRRPREVLRLRRSRFLLKSGERLRLRRWLGEKLRRLSRSKLREYSREGGVRGRRRPGLGDREYLDDLMGGGDGGRLR